MPILFSAVAAVVPMIIYLLFIWKFDKYEREPFGYVIKHFIWGAIGAIIFSVLISSIITFFISSIINEEELELFNTVVTAPVVEEIMKGMFLLVTVVDRKFDNMTDGIVYGGAIGLGFGMTENFLYFIMYGTNPVSWIFIVVIRTLFTAVMHCVSTATFGASLGIAKFISGIMKFIIPLIGLLLAMLIHFLWNYSVSFSYLTLHGFIFLTASIILFIYIFSKSVKNESKLILNQLNNEVESGLIPSGHPAIISSEIRHKKGWIEETIRKEYIDSTIKLAFRKSQYENSFGLNKNFYFNEVNYLKNKISNLLNINKTEINNEE